MTPARHVVLVPAVLTLVAGGTIAAAWGFELIGGFVPCALCLEERVPYYIGIPIVLGALVVALADGPGWLRRLLLAATTLVFAYGAWLGVYHAGAEWGFWPGPADCGAGSAAPTTSADDILAQIQGMRIVSCTDASWRFPEDWGLSFAGWNAAISIFLAALAAWGALRKRETRSG